MRTRSSPACPPRRPLPVSASHSAAETSGKRSPAPATTRFPPFCLRPGTKHSLLGVVLATSALSCSAQTGLAIQGGDYEDYETVGMQLVLEDWFRAERAGWRVVGYPELQLNRHKRDGDNLLQGGVFATFRADPAHAKLRPYLEAGLGLNLFSRGDLGPKSFGTRFQFGEHVGIGFVWGGNTGGPNETWLGLRYSHYSNAGIKNPNPGLEALQLVFGHRF